MAMRGPEARLRPAKRRESTDAAGLGEDDGGIPPGELAAATASVAARALQGPTQAKRVNGGSPRASLGNLSVGMSANVGASAAREAASAMSRRQQYRTVAEAVVAQQRRTSAAAAEQQSGSAAGRSATPDMLSVLARGASGGLSPLVQSVSAQAAAAIDSDEPSCKRAHGSAAGGVPRLDSGIDSVGHSASLAVPPAAQLADDDAPAPPMPLQTMDSLAAVASMPVAERRATAAAQPAAAQSVQVQAMAPAAQAVNAGQPQAAAAPQHAVIRAPWGQDVVDIDAPRMRDPMYAAEVAEDVMAYMRELEVRFRPQSQYMKRQRDINHRMRTILVDWLTEVAEEFRLYVQTLHRAVMYVDRFLSSMAVQRGKLQLVGVTCLMLAAKYEEVAMPVVDDYVFITDNTYTRGQLLRMEHVILRVLEFDMGGCTAFTFLERFLEAAGAPIRVHYLALYLCELTLLDGARFLTYLPSVVAAAAVSTAMCTFGLPPWTAELEYYTHLPRPDVQVCIADVVHAFREAPLREQHFIYDKYQKQRFLRISETGAPEDIPRLP